MHSSTTRCMQRLSAGVTMPLEAIYYHNPAAVMAVATSTFGPSAGSHGLVPVACQWGALVRRSASRCQGSTSGPVGPARGPQSQGCQCPGHAATVDAPGHGPRVPQGLGSHSPGPGPEAAPQPAGGQGRGPRAGPIPGLWATGTPCALAALHMATLGSYQPKRPGLAVCQWRWILAW